MTVTITKDKSNISDKKLTYNLYTVPLVSNSDSITNNISIINNYLKITNYPYNGKAAHIQHDIFGSMTYFTINEIRIYKGFYNNSSLEMIIETSSNTNDITYLCIPLSISSGTTNLNDLDIAIQSLYLSKEALCPTKLNLNNLIPKQDLIYYLINSNKTNLFDTSKSANNLCIVILNNAIPIVSDTFKIATTKLTNKTKSIMGNFNLNVLSTTGTSSTLNVYNYIQKQNITSPDGLSDANIYIDCNGADDTLINSKIDKYKLDEKDLKKIFLYLFIVVIFLLLFFVLDKLNRSSENAILKFLFKQLHKFYNLTIFGYKVSNLIIIILYLMSFLLFISSFIVKKNRVNLFISAISFTSTLFVFIFIQNLNSTIESI